MTPKHLIKENMEKGKLKQAIDACDQYTTGSDDDIINYDNYINAKNALTQEK